MTKAVLWMTAGPCLIVSSHKKHMELTNRRLKLVSMERGRSASAKACVALVSLRGKHLTAECQWFTQLFGQVGHVSPPGLQSFESGTIAGASPSDLHYPAIKSYKQEQLRGLDHVLDQDTHFEFCKPVQSSYLTSLLTSYDCQCSNSAPFGPLFTHLGLESLIGGP